MKNEKVSEQTTVIFECGCKVYNKLWYVPWHYNCLCYFDFETGENCQVCVVPGEVAVEERLYCKIYYYDGKLILVPFKANHLVTYDIQTGSFEQCATDMSKEQFYSAVLVDGNMYLIPYVGSNCYCYDIEKNEATLISALSQIVQETSKNGMGTLSVWYMDRKLYFLMYMTNIYIAYDLDTCQGYKNIVRLGVEEVFFDMMIFRRGLFFYSIVNPYAIWINFDSQEIKRIGYTDFFEELYPNLIAILNIFEEKIYVSLINSNNCLIFDIDNGSVHKENLFPNALNQNGGFVFTDKDELFLLPKYETQEIISCKGERWIFDGNIHSQMLCKQKLMEGMIYEKKHISLKSYLQALISAKEER